MPVIGMRSMFMPMFSKIWNSIIPVTPMQMYVPKSSFEFMATYDGEIPGAKVEECGNYQDHDLKGCNEEAAKYVEVLKTLTPDDMQYTYYLD